MKKLKATLISVGIMTAVSAILLALTALILGKMGALPRGAVPIITTVIGCIAVFLGSYLSSLYIKEKGILFGVLSGLLYSLCIALVSVLVFQNDFNIASAGKFIALLVSGSIGGILGVNRKSKVKF